MAYLHRLVHYCTVAVGDLITFLTSVLRGELTANFAAKAAVVLAIAGGIFRYYIREVQQKPLPVKSTDE